MFSQSRFLTGFVYSQRLFLPVFVLSGERFSLLFNNLERTPKSLAFQAGF